MNRLPWWCAALGLAIAVGTAQAMPGTFEIVQVFSNADATLQFVDVVGFGIQDCDSGEDLWAGFKRWTESRLDVRAYVVRRRGAPPRTACGCGRLSVRGMIG